jgi:hypothetical protein
MNEKVQIKVTNDVNKIKTPFILPIKVNFRKWDVGVWTGLSWLRMVVGTCECGNE